MIDNSCAYMQYRPSGRQARLRRVRIRLRNASRIRMRAVQNTFGVTEYRPRATPGRLK